MWNTTAYFDPPNPDPSFGLHQFWSCERASRWRSWCHPGAPVPSTAISWRNLLPCVRVPNRLRENVHLLRSLPVASPLSCGDECSTHLLLFLPYLSLLYLAFPSIAHAMLHSYVPLPASGCREKFPLSRATFSPYPYSVTGLAIWYTGDYY